MPATPMPQPRAFQTSTELLDGDILNAGGYDSFGFFNDAEIYDWHTGTWTTVAPMHFARAAAMAVRLEDGRVLVVGGFSVGFTELNTAEIYDPRTNTWTLTGSLKLQRAEDFTAALLPDGRVLVAGGYIATTFTQHGPVFLPTNTSEIWDPRTGLWSPASPMSSPRGEFTSTELEDGRILAAGGTINPAATPTATSEIYDPATGKWTPTGAMHQARDDQSGVLLLDGDVLVAGGEIGATVRTNTAELYDPRTGTWSTTGTMTAARSESDWATVRLADGNVLDAGGFRAEETTQASADLYNWKTGTWSPAGAMTTARAGHTAVLLRGNRGVLVMGGLVIPPASTASVDIYR